MLSFDLVYNEGCPKDIRILTALLKVCREEGDREGGRVGGRQASKQEPYLVSGENVLPIPLGGIGDQLRVGKRPNHLANRPVLLREGADARVS